MATVGDQGRKRRHRSGGQRSRDGVGNARRTTVGGPRPGAAVVRHGLGQQFGDQGRDGSRGTEVQGRGLGMEVESGPRPGMEAGATSNGPGTAVAEQWSGPGRKVTVWGQRSWDSHGLRAESRDDGLRATFGDGRLKATVRDWSLARSKGNGLGPAVVGQQPPGVIAEQRSGTTITDNGLGTDVESSGLGAMMEGHGLRAKSQNGDLGYRVWDRVAGQQPPRVIAGLRSGGQRSQDSGPRARAIVAGSRSRDVVTWPGQKASFRGRGGNGPGTRHERQRSGAGGRGTATAGGHRRPTV